MAAERSKQAPPVVRPPSIDELLARLQDTLRAKFCLEPLPEFSIIVEGGTDRDYLQIAAQLAQLQFGEDLLAVPSHLSTSGSKIAIVTPFLPGSIDAPNSRARGGIPQVVRLAEELKSYVFLEIVGMPLFVFDHDDAGLDAQKKIQDLGYKPGQHSITLDPRSHPRVCATKQVVIEDLLSLGIQQSYFAQGNSYCSVDYTDGQVIRFRWGHESKHLLRDHVRTHATWSDVLEVGRVLARARNVLGFPVNQSVFQ